MEEFLSRLDIIVLPSRSTNIWREQFGRILIEAMACEVPVIGSDSGEIPQTVGGCGRIFGEGNSEELEAIISELHDDPNRRRELAAKGKERVQREFSYERVGNRYIELFESLL
jgi:glycosyltransferase involved in cell wall biosynthesis